MMKTMGGQMGLGHYEINEDMSQRLIIMKFVVRSGLRTAVKGRT